jgi:pimeloyl-ACP methyl ester carboxylesterase
LARGDERLCLAPAAVGRDAAGLEHDRAGADPRQTCPTAEPSWYDGVGHTPHLEDPDSFNGELAALTRRVSF